jgi:hypothetical protein
VEEELAVGGRGAQVELERLIPARVQLLQLQRTTTTTTTTTSDQQLQLRLEAPVARSSLSEKMFF